MASSLNTLVGRCMTQWWDCSVEAGASRRESTGFEEQPPSLDVLTISTESDDAPLANLGFYNHNSHPEGLKKLASELENETFVLNAVKGMRQGSASVAGTEGGQPRTSASPEWDGSPPWNFRRTMDASGIPSSDFDTANSLQASGILARDPAIKICLSTAGNLWLVNRTDRVVELGPGELFGFNVGSYVEIPPGIVCKIYDGDKTLVALVRAAAGGGAATKTIMSIAEIMCSVTRERGITEMRLVDHDMGSMFKVLADGQQRALQYRYRLTPKEKINSFKPRPLEDGVDKDNLRAAVFGAIYHQRYNAVPMSSYCRVVWEVGCY
eukprot:Skav217638  [mRNA]  locus=scaffold73:25285:27312:+ [translate_table: standard]